MSLAEQVPAACSTPRASGSVAPPRRGRCAVCADRSTKSKSLRFRWGAGAGDGLASDAENVLLSVGCAAVPFGCGCLSKPPSSLKSSSTGGGSTLTYAFAVQLYCMMLRGAGGSCGDGPLATPSFRSTRCGQGSAAVPTAASGAAGFARLGGSAFVPAALGAGLSRSGGLLGRCSEEALVGGLPGRGARCRSGCSTQVAFISRNVRPSMQRGCTQAGDAVPAPLRSWALFCQRPTS